MPLSLSLIFTIGSILTFLFVMRYIRKSRVRIEDTLFWIFFCGVLIIISIFPKIPFWISDQLGFQSPINLVYTLIIFILIVNQFYMTIKMSQLHIKQKELVQRVALDKVQPHKKENQSDGK